MTWTPRFEAAFGVDPVDAVTVPDWVDLSDRVRMDPGLEWEGGRFRELDEMREVTGKVVLDNLDRELDPNNAAGAWFGQIVPMVPFRLGVNEDATDHWLLQGFVQSWTPRYPNARKDAVVVARLVDGLGWLELVDAGKPYPDVVLEDNPIGYWQLDETSGTVAGDDSGNANDGTSSGTVTVGEDGPFYGGARAATQFAATGVVTIPHDVVFDVTTGITIECWVYIDVHPDHDSSLATNDFRMVVQRQELSESVWSLLLEQDLRGWAGSVFVDGTRRHMVGLNDPADLVDKWTHVVFTYDASSGLADIYIDGELINSHQFGAGTIDTSTSDIRISDPDPSGGEEHFWPGRIAQVAIYDYALSAERIATHFLNRFDTAPAERSDVRIGKLLDAAQWPTGRRSLEIGQSNVAAYSGPGSGDPDSILSLARSAAHAEGGLIFAEQGNIVFQDRHYRLFEQAVSNATFADDATGVDFSELEPATDEDLLYNIFRVRTPTTEFEVFDATSRRRYGSRVLPLNVDISDVEAFDRAHWARRRFSQAVTRFEKIRLDGHRSATVRQAIYDLAMSDRVSLTLTPPGGGDPYEVDAHIEHISARIQDKTFVVEYRLTPAETEEFWVIGDAELSLVGISTVFGY
jgi:hypothetical protein